MSKKRSNKQTDKPVEAKTEEVKIEEPVVEEEPVIEEEIEKTIIEEMPPQTAVKYVIKKGNYYKTIYTYIKNIIKILILL